MWNSSHAPAEGNKTQLELIITLILIGHTKQKPANVP